MAAREWMRANSFYPTWLPPRWRRTSVGYAAATVPALAAIALIYVLVTAFSRFPFSGVLALMTVVLVALTFGAGPSLLATLVGAVLLYYAVLPPHFSWDEHDVLDVAGVLLFAAAGCVVSVLASQVERARRQADHARAEAEVARDEARAGELALREANGRMDEFLGIAGHELRTPLTSAQLNVQIMRRQLGRLVAIVNGGRAGEAGGVGRDLTAALERLRDQGGSVERQLQRQNRLVNDLLDVSRIQQGRLELNVTPIDVASVVREAVEEQRLASPERTITMRVADGTPSPVRADADRIGQVVTNYLTNALKYSPKDKPVAVEVRRDGGSVRVSVRDEGPGLPPAEQARVWERFHRAAGVVVQSGSGIGLGLGLYFSHEIVERHGGHVGIESTPGAGAVVWFTLPADTADA